MNISEKTAITGSVTKFRVDPIWSHDKLEAWLEQMAREGLRLVSVNTFCIYTFECAPPAEVVYRLDFFRKNDVYYQQLLTDTGWEHVQTLVGWQYWRAKVVNGKRPEILTDIGSKIQKHKRILALMSLTIAYPIACTVVFLLAKAPTDFLDGMMRGSWVIAPFGLYGAIKTFAAMKRIKSPRA